MLTNLKKRWAANRAARQEAKAAAIGISNKSWNLSAGPGTLPPVEMPKAKKGATSLSSWKTQLGRATAVITQPDRGLANTDITTYRTGANTPSVIRDLAASNPDLSATMNAYLRVGIPEEYSLVARDMDGEINADASRTAREVLNRMTLIGDPTLGYNPTTDIQSLSESLGKELFQYGSMALELVLNKQLTPAYMQPVSVTKLKWKEEEGGVYPVQVISGKEISLDIPTFFYLSVDQDLLTPYSQSPVETAIQAVLADAQFMNDLRKAMHRVIQPRLVATLLEERIAKTLDPAIRADQEKYDEFMDGLVEALTEQLTNLEPEEALVSWDNVEYDMLTTDKGGGDSSSVWQAVQKLIENKLTAGAKSLPAVLGRDAQASSATTSSMLFLKNANIIRSKLNVLYSRALTMALRLLGLDVMVEFKYAKLDLRPDAELAAYRSMEQSSKLELLSLGMKTDDEVCLELTGRLPPKGYTPKAGTMFKNNPSKVVENPDSQTSTMKTGGAKDNLQPSTPSNPKS